MVEDNNEETVVDRAAYGLVEENLSFSKNEDIKPLGEIKDDYESIITEPINHVLATFQKDYLKNERVAYQMFLDLQNALVDFSKQIDGNPIYGQMDIVKKSNDCLILYRNWVTMLRQGTLNALEKMKEVKEVIDRRYVTTDELDEVKQNASETIKDNQGKLIYLKESKEGVPMIPLGPSTAIELKLTSADAVYVKKAKLSESKTRDREE